MDKPAASIPSPSGIARKNRRQNWWAERKKSRDEKREGLRKLMPDNKMQNNHTTLVEQNNKGGFKTSVATRNALSQAVVPGKMKVEMKSQTKLNFKTVKSNAENSKKKNNKVKVKEEVKEGLPNVHIAGEQTSSKHMAKAYVLFVGNLPFNISKEQLEEHFRKTGGVKMIRIPKEKGTDKARGFAYIEFKDRISHGIALRLHQTTLAGRKINVEFTSIGGKNKKRLEKLKLKNLSKAKFKMPLEH
ncbi:uncharacterized RNA-binding protein C365.04c-like [Mizuhopecten yessoensis]|uniref:RRM domain-containing protein n=1 Tax=Mizuhopecten yessoensis TaxID=6573 RepID=A0A210PRG3_MIZYE|nr:uncharacterized RNA-binding protein C365.04c-like [Mizuhopecten yessoensis]OWF39068.1 hypothetical protein KP79_PYT03931 [Mizuhopecten yessoensis]